MASVRSARPVARADDARAYIGRSGILRALPDAVETGEERGLARVP